MVKVTKFEIIAVVITCFILDTIFQRPPGSAASIVGVISSAVLTMGFGAILQKTAADSKLWWLCYPIAAGGWVAGFLF